MTEHLTLEQALAAKNALEQSLQSEIHEQIERFKEQTGLSPCSVQVSMLEATRLEDSRPQCMLAEVRVEVLL